MAKSLHTDAEVFAAYRAYAEDVMAGRSTVDVPELRMYGLDASTLTSDVVREDFASMTALLLFGESGVGQGAPNAVSSAREFYQQVGALLLDAQNTIADPNPLSASDFDARAHTVTDQLIAEMEALIAADPTRAAYLPSTQAEQDRFREGIGDALTTVADARYIFSEVMAGDIGPDEIAVASASLLRAGMSIAAALPIPGIATAKTVVSMATTLVPGIIAMTKGHTSPTEIVTFVAQAALSYVSFGASDFLFDYIAPIIVSAAVNALEGSDGPVDLSPQAISQGLLEAAILDNGGTLPDWWNNAAGGDGEAYTQASDRADVIAEALNNVHTNLYTQIAAQYGTANFYQELTISYAAELGTQQYVFARVDGAARNSEFGALFNGTTDPWSMIREFDFQSAGLLDGQPPFWGAPAPTRIFDRDALYVLEHGTSITSFTENRDSVYAFGDQDYQLLGNDDVFALRQEIDGRPGQNTQNFYATARVASVDGGQGVDTLDMTQLTGAVVAGYTGDLIIDHNSVSYLTWNTSVTGPGNQRQILFHTNFETIIATDFRLIDMFSAAHGMKIIAQDAGTATEVAEITGSRFGDTIIVDTARMSVLQNPAAPNFLMTDSAARQVHTYAGAGNDYVTGELITGTRYDGGVGVDTFEIIWPDTLGSTNYYRMTVDLESGAASMIWSAFNRWFTETSSVTNFEWAVGSSVNDVIYARNAGSRIDGGGQHDTLIGRAGNDQLLGGDGNDNITGGEGVNRLEGGAGSDVIIGGSNQDVILGGTGNDTINGGDGNNLIFGQENDDHINAGCGDDTIDGGTGNDFINAGDGLNQVDAGLGNDGVYSGSGDDSIRLGHGLDEAFTGAGNDVIHDVWAGNVIYNVAARHPLYNTYHRSATIDGGDGYDVLTLDYSGLDIEFGDFGYIDWANFTVDFFTGTQERWSSRFVPNDPNDLAAGGTWVPTYWYQEVANIEEFILTNGTFTVDFASFNDYDPDVASAVAGLNNDQAVQTGDNADTVRLGAGNDIFFVNLGDDTADGEEGLDTLDLSRLPIGHSYDLSNFNTDGTGTIDVLDAGGAVVSTTTVAGFEGLAGSDAAETFTMDEGVNLLRGRGGNDTLRGGEENDIFAFGVADDDDLLPDATLGDILRFEGPSGTVAPTFQRSGDPGNYTYVVSFGTTTVTFNAPDLRDFNTTTSQNIRGEDTWDLQIIDGTVVANDDSGTGFETDEDTAITTPGVLANDIDPGAANVTITAYDTVSASGAIVTRVGDTDQFRYDPGAVFDGLIDGQSATDTFTYTISDGDQVRTATVSVLVTGFTDNPVAYDDAAQTDQNTAVTIDAYANDLDPGAADSTVVAFDATSARGGTVTHHSNGVFVYTPAPSFAGLDRNATDTDTFTYSISDGRYTSTATVTVTITGTNDPVTATDDTLVLREDQVATLNVTANDVDPDDDPLTITAVSTPNVGTAQIVNGQIQYTPPLNYNGSVTFTYDVTDGLTTDTASVTLTYVAVDDPPVATPDTATVTAGDWLTIDALANDADPESGDLRIFTAYSPLTDIGEVRFDDNFIYYRAPVGFTGVEQIAYGIFDDSGQQGGSTVDVTVIGELAPRYVFSLNGVEDTPITINALSGWIDDNGDTLQLVSIDTSASNGAAVDNGDGTYTLTPPSDLNGLYTIPVTVTVTDGIHTVARNQSIYLQDVTDPWTVNTDVFRITPGEVLTFNTTQLMANDTNPDFRQWAWVLNGGAAVNGALGAVAGQSHLTTSNGSHPFLYDGVNWLPASRSYGEGTFTPDAGFHGLASFTYRLINGYNQTEFFTGDVLVYVDNDAVLQADTASTLEDTAIVIDVLGNDSDADGDALTIAEVTGLQNGTVEILPDNTLRYTPDANWSGTETFTYRATTEFHPEGVTAEVTVTVDPVDDAIAANDDTMSATEDTSLDIVLTDLVANDTNPDGRAIVLDNLGTASHGTVTENGGTLTYTPDANFNGTDSFTYTLSDGLGGTTTATVTVNVTAVNDPAEVARGTATTTEDTEIRIAVGDLITDIDGLDTITLASALAPAHGTVVLEDLRETQDPSLPLNQALFVVYAPDANFAGSDVIEYRVSDGSVESVGMIDVTVTNVDNDAPTAVDDNVRTNEDTAVSINVTGNDTDPDGDTLTVTSVSQAANGTVGFTGGQITYTPHANWNGTETLTYTITDAGGLTSTATLTVTVDPVNDAPTVVGDPISVSESGSVTLDFLANDTDVDGDTLTVINFNGQAFAPNTYLQLASGATLWMNPDQTVTLITNGAYEHLAESGGAGENFYYVVSDGNGGTAAAGITFLINGENDRLTFDPLGPLSVTSDTTSLLDLSALNLADVDGHQVTVTLDVTAGALHFDAMQFVQTWANADGSLSIGGDITRVNAFLGSNVFFVDPANDPFGQSAELLVSVSDNVDTIDVGRFAIDVVGVADAANVTGTIGTVTGTEDTPLTLGLPDISIVDVDSDVLVTFSGLDAGTLSGAAGTGVLVANPNATTLTLAGGASDVTAYLQGSNLTYTPAADANGTQPGITVTVSQPDGTAPVDAGTLSIELTPTLDAPAITGLEARSLVEGTPVILAPNVTIDAPDMTVLNGAAGDFSGSSVSIISTTPTTDSIFDLAASPDFHVVETAQGWELHTDAGQFGSVSIGTAGIVFGSGVQDTETLMSISFGGDVTPTTDLVHSVLRSITIDTAYERFEYGNPNLSWTFAQPGGATTNASAPVYITYVDDPFTLTPPTATFTVTEDTAGRLDFAGVVGGDPDTSWAFFTVELSVSQGTLSLAANAPAPAAGYTVQELPSGNLQISSFFQLDFGAALGNGVVYTPPADLAGVGVASIDVNVTASFLGTGPVPDPIPLLSIPIDISPVNDPAVFSGDVSASMSEDAAGVTGLIVVSDVDDPAMLQAGRINGTYGFAEIAADGQWSYTRTADLNGLVPGESVVETLTFAAIDGTMGTLEITVAGEADAQVFEGTSNADLMRGTDGPNHMLGLAGADTLQGQGGADTMDGGVDNDLILGGDGGDSLIGNFGNDTLDGGRQADTLYGNDGDDALIGGGHSDRVYGGEGSDTLEGGFGWDFLQGDAGFDSLDGGDGRDILRGGLDADTLRGRAGEDTLLGHGHADQLWGGSGSDVLDGGFGWDYLHGGDGDDTLLGASGHDRLVAGAGNDVMTGGGHADTFQFRTGNGNNRITDFELGIDVIYIQSGATSFSELLISDLGTDAGVAFSNVFVRLENVSHTDLSATDFLFN